MYWTVCNVFCAMNWHEFSPLETVINRQDQLHHNFFSATDVVKINKPRGVKSHMPRIWKDADPSWLNSDYFRKSYRAISISHASSRGVEVFSNLIVSRIWRKLTKTSSFCLTLFTNFWHFFRCLKRHTAVPVIYCGLTHSIFITVRPGYLVNAPCWLFSINREEVPSYNVWWRWSETSCELKYLKIKECGELTVTSFPRNGISYHGSANGKTDSFNYRIC